MSRILVPATTANLGPGFDCLGMALSLYNEIEVLSAPDARSVTNPSAETRLWHAFGSALSADDIEVEGEGTSELPHDVSNLIVRSMQRVFDQVGYQATGLHLRSFNRIPMMGGLGSSSAAIVGGLVAANALTNNRLTRDELLSLAIEIEGHPDNVAPALLGGLVIIAADEHGPIVDRIDVPEMKVVAIHPDLRVATKTARRILPTTVSRADAIFNAGRVALVTLALSRGDFDLLGRAMDDRLHQPLRKFLIIGYDDVVSAAKSAGAAAIAISGSGPSMIAFAPDHHDAIGQAMQDAFAANKIESRIWILNVDREGARVIP